MLPLLAGTGRCKLLRLFQQDIIANIAVHLEGKREWIGAKKRRAAKPLLNLSVQLVFGRFAFGFFRFLMHATFPHNWVTGMTVTSFLLLGHSASLAG